MKSRDLALAGLFCALMAVSAHIRIPMPVVSSVTLQTLTGFILALLVSPLSVFFAMAAYLILGLVGLPIFSFGGGLSSFLQPGFGFLLAFPIAFPLCSHVFCRLRKKLRPFLAAAVSCLAALFLLYASGLLYGSVLLNQVLKTPMGAWDLLRNFCLLFLPFDLLKILAAVFVSGKIQKALR